MELPVRDARWEFCFLIRNCSCSRACLSIEEWEVEDAKEMGIDLVKTEPTCTPEKCFPNLYKQLYPHGGCPAISSHVTDYSIKKEKKK